MVILEVFEINLDFIVNCSYKTFRMILRIDLSFVTVRGPCQLCYKLVWGVKGELIFCYILLYCGMDFY